MSVTNKNTYDELLLRRSRVADGLNTEEYIDMRYVKCIDPQMMLNNTIKLKQQKISPYDDERSVFSNVLQEQHLRNLQCLCRNVKQENYRRILVKLINGTDNVIFKKS